MDPITAATIAGGAGIAGQLLQNQGNSEQAKRQMYFQKEMSDTAHQREVTDLRAAGLNPILSALGSGASTPGGAQASMANLGEGISKGMDTAIAIRSQNKELDMKDADIDLKHDQAKNLAVQRSQAIPQTQIMNQHAAQEQIRTKIINETANAAIKKAKAEGDYSEINQIMGVINSGASSAGQLINPFKNMMPDFKELNKTTSPGKK